MARLGPTCLLLEDRNAAIVYRDSDPSGPPRTGRWMGNLGQSLETEIFGNKEFRRVSMFASHFARFAFATTFCAALVLALVTAPAQGQTPTTIYTFAGNGEPANPLNSSVAQGRDGNYYFSTCIPTTLDSVLFNITPSGTLTTVYTPINCSAGVTLGT